MPRLTKIYTRTGDDGTTGIADGSRISKNSDRIHAMGDVDELNSLIGIVRCHVQGQIAIDTIFKSMQHRLFDIGAEMAMPDQQLLTDAQVTRLEEWLDKFNDALPSLQEFILPGGNPGAAHCHHARTVCRRAERSLLRLSANETVNSATLRYLNRLSDLLFVLARTLARRKDGQEVFWQKGVE